MKKLQRIIHKLVFFINSLVAFALLLSFILPYISPRTFPLLSVLSLAVSPLIVINVVFMIYWLVLLKKHFLISFVVLLLGFSHLTSLYKFVGSNSDDQGSLSLMSYNVHTFNRFDWIDSKTIPEDISFLVKKQNPDILCVQEYYNDSRINFNQYPYKYKDFNNNSDELALVIFSKYPIVKKGSLKFEVTANNIIFADVKYKNDTVRIYNVHLQSHHIHTLAKNLEKNSKKLLGRIGASFVKQQTQMEKLTAHMQSSPYTSIVMGDFNNTAYSYVYDKIVTQGLHDAFKEAGEGFGKTYNFKFFPTRIDFILPSENFEVLEFITFKEELSDHYPIFAKIKEKEN